MKVLKSGATQVEKIINRKTLSADKPYRLSLYTYLYGNNGRYTILNTMTSEVIELTEDEFSAVSALKEPKEYEYLEQHGLIELANKRYIVETDYDEVGQYKQTVFILKTMSREKKGLRNYTILPTTGCNARCVYCYEEGYAVKTMTEKTADRLVDFICETMHDDKIDLRWFGGEPLANAPIMRRICTKLEERNVQFKSSMITNGSLMTKELAHEAKTLWNLQRVQVSLDGAKEDYTLRKNYKDPKRCNYDVVMQAIHFLADEGIKIQLRVNVDFDNIERIEGFLKDIKTEFGDMENISLYIAPLFQLNAEGRGTEINRKVIEIDKMIKALGIPHQTMAAAKAEFRLNACMADGIDKSIVIEPDGQFNTCEHLPDDRSWGNIFDGVTDQALFDKLRKTAEIHDQCRKCPFLPQCTPFYREGCPVWFQECCECYCLKIEQMLRELAEEA